ncbi:MAG: PEGA domain-containing protein [Candidatus Pacebacteria bacterium]|nr:PEGA domain-containing protein [Candidatus Paceibacterota bacterium]
MTARKIIPYLRGFFFNDKRFCLIFFWLIFLFSSFPQIVSGQLVMSEFSPLSSEADWVEIYNSGEEPVNLGEYFLIDAAGNQNNFPACDLCSRGFFSLDWNNRLNNSGDRIILKKGELEIDCVAYNSGPFCRDREIDLPDLNEEFPYGARNFDDSGEWVRSDRADKAGNSDCQLLPSPNPSPLPTTTAAPTPTIAPVATLPLPTPSPVPVTATGKINEVKNEAGVIVNQVEIYLDGAYINHWAPEVLTFGENRYCNDAGTVACSLGSHLISLEKSGYETWQTTVEVEAGDYFELDPVLADLEPTPLPSPTVFPSATPTPPITPIVFSSPAPAVELTGPAASEASKSSLNFFPEEASSGQSDQSEKGSVLGESASTKRPFFILAGSGLVLIGLALAFFR